ncbi:Uncharacterized protein GBIM_05134 [Gryllus bimaculatus]|nr:Uncharacterized protein GBIM_05134 [Gryllus bimaculatus]
MWGLKVAVCALLTVAAASTDLSSTSNEVTNRKERNLLLYNHLFQLPQVNLNANLNKNNSNKNNNNNNNAESSRLDHHLCDSPDGTTGICYTKEDCENLGGMSLASCDNGEGVCCLVEKSCRNVTTHAMSYFVNPSYPNQDSGTSFCDFRIDVTNKNICQLRLDLEQFSLAAPHRHMGICRNDRFIAMTSLPNGIGISELCGENHGQHFYVPVDATYAGSTSVSLMIMTSGGKPYHWRIRITQVDCKETPELAAPPGCLQYHTEMKGVLESFNYAGGGGHYQTNLDYAVCIRRSPNTCRIVFTQPEDSVFVINSAEGAELADGVGRAGTTSCDLTTHDYVHIPGGRYDGPTMPGLHTEDEMDEPDEDFSYSTADKFCGNALSGLAITENVERLRSGYTLDPIDNSTVSSPVTSYSSGPIVVRFHTDGISEPHLEVGWRIEYQQMVTGCKRHFG